MQRHRFPIFFVLALISQLAIAESETTIASDSRDASAAYIGTQNFIVEQLGNNCLSLISRKETPKEFIKVWQERNKKYLLASTKYMEKRLNEALSSGGTKAREQVFQQYIAAVGTNGQASVKRWMEQGSKNTACQKAIATIDHKELDITSKVSMFADLEALVAWSERQH